MEIMIVLAGLLVAVVGGVSFASTIQRLKKRLRALEQHDILQQERAAAQLNTLLETAQQQFEQRFNVDSTLSAINLATQQAVQHIVSLREAHQSQLQTTLQQLETAKQQAMADINYQHAAFLQLKQEVEQLLAICRNQLTETMRQLEIQQHVLTPLAQQLLSREQDVDLAEIQSTEIESFTEISPESPPATTSDVIATLPEISFETAFINNHVIQRERRTARQWTESLPDGVVLEMIYIPGGTFIMGSEDTECATPPHSVSIKPFLAGKYPITQEQWEAVMGNNPSKFRGARHPVETVNWRDAVLFCAKLSQLTENHYQLFTEARWEYACRAGNVTHYCFGDELVPELANYEDSGVKQTSPVGIYPANAFGLYDMHGNVWEWCEDIWHENYVDAPHDGTVWDDGEPHIRLLRGGSWYNTAQKLYSATRIGFDTVSRYDNEGFRVMRLLEVD